MNSPPLYKLLPLDYPYPLIRVCSTEEDICAIPVSRPAWYAMLV
jgi:hypothetical protein